ncbi:DUF6268 family outer membrane beta-barrel protein [Lacipirellula parvula]|uniref:DUF6268 domain-containing protein n=1 Tax=Lacipirellula parvula TaxID=2650471 RepID=A0A5K7XE82_9BACT|nr:DUF6268 family outer membrane beta-barrel protein [Lacipirellula parvula]BBO31319.1 hypothetical protein PLANPX_0931 [Lacipirellula parvula]
MAKRLVTRVLQLALCAALDLAEAGAQTPTSPANPSAQPTPNALLSTPPELVPLPPVEDEAAVGDYALLQEADALLAEETLAEGEEVDGTLSDSLRKRAKSKGALGGGAPVALGGFWSPKVDVDGQASQLAMNAEFARVSLPLAMPAEGKPLWIGIAKLDRLELATDAILPDSGQRVPSQLWSVQTGVMNIRPLASGATVGGTAMFGSASDQPYAATRDLTLTAIAFYNKPAKNERDDWNFSIFYSPTSQLPYPLPGVAYVWRPSEQFEAKIGLPPALDYRPNEEWQFTATYMPLTNFDARVRRTISEDFSLLAYYRTNNETYFLADRLEDDQRFYVFDQRAAVGLERALFKGFTLELTAAYLFDRELFQGTSFTDDRTDEVEFDPGLGLSFQLQWRR